MTHKMLSLLFSLCACTAHAQTEVQDIPASLSEVFAPVRVAAAPSDAYIGLSLLADGELRH